MNCKHDYKSIGFGVERCTKCQLQRVVNKELYKYHVHKHFNELKDEFELLNKMYENRDNSIRE